MAYSFVRLVCERASARGVERIEERHHHRVNWMPNWRRTQFRSKKAIHLSMRSGSCSDVLSPAFRNTTKRDDAKRGDDLDREREKKRERERERESDSKREKERCATDRPFVPFFFYAGINGDIFKALFRNNHKKEPFKNISVERKERRSSTP